jgi:hypothetical protein
MLDYLCFRYLMTRLQVLEVIPYAKEEEICFALNDANGDVHAAIAQLLEDSKLQVVGSIFE